MDKKRKIQKAKERLERGMAVLSDSTKKKHTPLKPKRFQITIWLDNDEIDVFLELIRSLEKKKKKEVIQEALWEYIERKLPKLKFPKFKNKKQ